MLRALGEWLGKSGPPVVAAALLAEIYVPRLHSPLRELPYFFGLWAVCALVWNSALDTVRQVRRVRASRQRNG